MARKSMKTIADLTARVRLCTQTDVVTANGEYALSREDVLTAWACIEPKSASMFAREGGFSIGEANTKQTHVITIRYRRDFDITHTAWIYEARLQSAPRWYKVLAVVDYDEWWVLKCRLYQKDDMAVPPEEKTEKPVMPGSAVPLPPGVRL